MLQAAVFVLGSVPIVYVSRASLAAPRSHGFFRFFAWELILALFALAAEVWFRDPFAPHQLVSWPLLCLCVVPLVLGVRSLRSAGRPNTRRDAEPQLLAFERTTSLVTTGIYRYIRHPLYSSLLFLAWGAFLKEPTLFGAALVVIATAALLATAKVEEAENTSKFGVDYTTYVKTTKMFVPFVF